jgi:sugar lactone lactonase YvrE
VKRIAATIGLLILLLLGYLIFWPVPIEPVKWDAPENQGYRGDFAPNTDLADLELLGIGDIHGPEDVVSLPTPDGLQLFISSQEGKIMRLSMADNAVHELADTGGVPLGMEMDKAGNLIVADAYKGLLSVAMDGTVTVLTNAVDGTPILYADDLDIGPDGVIYFSDASTKFGAEAAGSTMAGSLLEILEHGRTGRVLAYDPKDQSTRIVMDDLSFSNGVAMGPDGTSILVNETGRYRVYKHWISGPRSGQTEVLLDNLPGFPDNINSGPDGTYFVGLISQRSKFLDDNSEKPGLRKLALRLPQWMQPKAVSYGFIFQMDGDGNVLKTWQDPSGSYPDATGAIIAEDGYMYVSSLTASKLARRPFP